MTSIHRLWGPRKIIPERPSLGKSSGMVVHVAAALLSLHCWAEAMGTVPLL